MTAEQAPETEEGEETRDRGVSTIEVVLLAPIIIMFVLYIVALGVVVDVRGATDGAARDAVRAASIQRNQAGAQQAAQAAADADLQGKCAGGVPPIKLENWSTAVNANGQPNMIDVVVTCNVDMGTFSLIHIGNAHLVSTAVSPLDSFREAG